MCQICGQPSGGRDMCTSCEAFINQVADYAERGYIPSAIDLDSPIDYMPISKEA